MPRTAASTCGPRRARGSGRSGRIGSARLVPRPFCGRSCIDARLGRSGDELGYVLDLALWRLPAHSYDARLDCGYARRTPPEAATCFGNVGLAGAFWTIEAAAASAYIV